MSPNPNSTRHRPCARLRRASWPCAALFLALVLAAPVEARGPRDDGAAYAKPRVLLLPMQHQDGVSEVVPNRIQEYLKTILQISGSADVMTLDNLAPLRSEREEEEANRPVPKSDPVLKKADDILWDAKELAGKGKYAKASQLFSRAMALYAKKFDVLEDFDKYVDAALGVSLAQFMADRPGAGGKALAPVLALRPDLLLDKRRVPKSAIDILDRLRKAAKDRARGSVTVDSTPRGTDVFLDGIRVGKTPHTLRSLPKGKHVIRLVANGRKPWAKVFRTSKGDQRIRGTLRPIAPPKVARKARAVAPSVEPLVQAVARGRLPGPFVAHAKKVCAYFSLDAIVLTYVRKSRDFYQIAPFLYDQGQRKIAELDWLRLDQELTTMQVSLLSLEERLVGALAAFPQSRVLRKTSDIFENIEAKRLAAEKAAAAVAQKRAAREAKAYAAAQEKRKKQEALEAERKRRAELVADARREAAAAKAAAAQAKRAKADEAKARRQAARQAKKDAKRAKADEARRKREARVDARLAHRAAKKEAARERALEKEDRKRMQREARAVAAAARRDAKRARERAAQQAREAQRAAAEADLAAKRARKAEEQAARQIARERAQQRARDAAETRRAAEERERYESEQRESARYEARKRERARRARPAPPPAAPPRTASMVDDGSTPGLGNYGPPPAPPPARVAAPTPPPRRESRISPPPPRPAATAPPPARVARSPATPSYGPPPAPAPADSPSPSALDRRPGPAQSVGYLEPVSSPGIWYKKWWVWAGTGAAVLAVSAALIAAGDDSQPEGFRASVTW